MTNTEKIQRVTSKGQVTLPIAWRRQMGNTNNIVLRAEGDSLIISPLRTEDERDAEWVTIFDAVRDNNGKGIPVEEMIKAFEENIARGKKHGRAS